MGALDFNGEALPWLESVVAFMTITYLWETYLDYRQYKKLKEKTVPPQLEGVVSPEAFSKARLYGLDKAHYNFVKSAFDQFESTVTLLLFFMPWLWQAAGKTLAYFGDPVPKDMPIWHEVAQTVIFLTFSTIYSQLMGLPWSLYSHFVIEEVHGFNKLTPKQFFKDLFLSNLISAIIGPPVIALLIHIVHWGGPTLVLKLWLFAFMLTVVGMTIYPVLIAPLFNKYVPLPEGSLRVKIEALAASQNYPLKKLFVVDGSKRSAHSNAYLYGFYKNKRIVLYDTLLKDSKDESEIVAVIAHELGHWKLSHTLYGFAISQVLYVLVFGGYVLVRDNAALFRSFGFSGETQPVLVGLLLFTTISAPVFHVLGFAQNIMSRSFEFQADAFGVSLGYAKALRSGLIRLQEQNLSTMNVDPWYSSYHYSHPPLVERLAAIDDAAKKSK